VPENGSQDKSEKATPKRRRDARKKGNVAKSREIPSVAVLLAGLGTLSLTASSIYTHMTGLMSQTLSQVGLLKLGSGDGTLLFHRAAMTLASVVLPVMLVVTFVAVLTNYVQIGALFTVEPLKPKFDKINPMKGLKNLFSIRTLFEAAKNLMKLIIIGYIAYLTLKGEWDNLPALVNLDTIQILIFILQVAFKVFLRCCLAILILAVLDYAYQKWQYEKNLRMSKQDVKDEFKQREGDPLVKSRIRAIQRKLASQRMMEAVPEADVVVTNPTHLAVALKYISGEMEAPQVVAKGAGLVAERIKQLAEAYGVPIVENKPLAQSLFKLEVGRIIPVELYQAVAQLLAYVYSLKGGKAARGAAA